MFIPVNMYSPMVVIGVISVIPSGDYKVFFTKNGELLSSTV